MPLYAYRCTHCDYSFEKIQSFSSKPEEKCPECGGKLVRPLTAPGLSFKGAGWYVNDYSSKGSAKSAKTEKTEKTEGSAGTEAKASSGESSGAASPAAAAPAASGSTGSTD